MKKIYLFALAALAMAGCAKDAPAPAPDGSVSKVEDLLIPASFDWKTMVPVVCDLNAPHASRVFVALEPGGEPFAAFIAGGGADAVSLALPVSARTVYISYETEEGVSASEAVAVAGNKVSYALAPKAKDYTGLEDGDKNSTEGNVIYMPARKNGWGTLLFEDLWPAYGDYDFNDFVANYKVQLYMNNKNKVRDMLIAVRVKAVGGSLPYDLYLSLQGVKGGEIDEIEPYYTLNASEDANLAALNSANNVKDAAVLKFENIRSNSKRPSGAKYLNTEPGYEMADADLVEVAYLVHFRNSIDFNAVAFDTFDFYLGYDRESDGRRMEIHMGGFKPSLAALADYNALQEGNSNIGNAERPYYSNDNLVWGLNIPTDVSHAYETTDFLKAYPEFKTWAQSGGQLSQEWYMHGVNDHLVSSR